jgi:hypothetical protein
MYITNNNNNFTRLTLNANQLSSILDEDGGGRVQNEEFILSENLILFVAISFSGFNFISLLSFFALRSLSLRRLERRKLYIGWEHTKTSIVVIHSLFVLLDLIA